MREEGERGKGGISSAPLCDWKFNRGSEIEGEREGRRERGRWVGGRERERQRRGRGEEERGKRHRDLIAVQLSAKASGCEQCSLRHSRRGRSGVRGGDRWKGERVYILGVFLKHKWPSLSFDL